MAGKLVRPVIQLTADQKTKLKGTEDDIERAEHALGVLKQLGMDVTELEGKLKWSKDAKDLMLKEFG